MPGPTDRYVIDPTNPAARMEDRIRELERQVRALMAAQGIRATTMSGGRLEIADEAGDTVATIGEGVWGSEFGSSQGRQVGLLHESGAYAFLVTDNDGLVWPPIRAPFHRLDAAVAVTSGAFVSTHRCYFTLSADSVGASITIGADGGTTGEIQLETVGPVQTTTLVTPAGTLQEYKFNWLLGPDGLGIPIGTGMSIDIRVRRTSGAGNINVHHPVPLRITDSRILGATVAGA